MLLFPAGGGYFSLSSSSLAGEECRYKKCFFFSSLRHSHTGVSRVSAMLVVYELKKTFAVFFFGKSRCAFTSTQKTFTFS